MTQSSTCTILSELGPGSKPYTDQSSSFFSSRSAGRGQKKQGADLPGKKTEPDDRDRLFHLPYSDRYYLRDSQFGYMRVCDMLRECA